VKTQDVVELLLLGTLWGGSFLFMRIASPEFGPIALIAVRVSVASLVLLPFLLHAGLGRSLLARGPELVFFGGINSALPFCLFAYATLSLSAGYTAVINAVAPLFTAIVAFVWLGERLSRLATIGRGVGFGGVVLLVSDKLGFDGGGATLGIMAAMCASLSYGVAANYTRARFTGVGSLVLATGSQLGASLLLLPLCFWFWPTTMPSANSWLAVLVLGVACTGIAYVFFFRLMARLGPSRAITVTFLVPLAAMVFGALFLDELVSLKMLLGCGLILLGTALAIGLLRLPYGRRRMG
jgi:drug/metabolite transporter (DMT)-like permease